MKKIIIIAMAIIVTMSVASATDTKKVEMLKKTCPNALIYNTTEPIGCGNDKVFMEKHFGGRDQMNGVSGSNNSAPHHESSNTMIRDLKKMKEGGMSNSDIIFIFVDMTGRVPTSEEMKEMIPSLH